MTLAQISKIHEYKDTEVTLRGWVYNKRKSGKIMFLILRDGTGFIQCIIEKTQVSEKVWETCLHLTQESSIIVKGVIRQDDRAPYCGYELTLKDIDVIQLVKEEYPISLKEHGPDFLLSYRHLWLRVPTQVAIMRIRSQVIKSLRQFFDDQDFVMVDAPIFTPSACEGTTTLFEVEYFDRKAYLSQSGQLYMEAAALALGKVYCFGPAFRAEKSKTRRHLTEFWIIEPEVAFLTFEENMILQENMVCYVVQQVLKNCKNELNVLKRDISKLENVKPPFPRITYDEAFEILKQEGSETEFGSDFGANDETIITKKFDKPIFVHHFPAEIKAFYMETDPNQPDRVLGMDLLAPEGYGEIIGGGQRLSDYDTLVSRIKQHNLPMEAFSWFLDLRKFGSVPHGGFGLGLERFIAWICGIEHVRETIPFPRTIYRIEP